VAAGRCLSTLLHKLRPPGTQFSWQSSMPPMLFVALLQNPVQLVHLSLNTSIASVVFFCCFQPFCSSSLCPPLSCTTSHHCSGVQYHSLCLVFCLLHQVALGKLVQMAVAIVSVVHAISCTPAVLRRSDTFGRWLGVQHVEQQEHVIAWPCPPHIWWEYILFSRYSLACATVVSESLFPHEFLMHVHSFESLLAWYGLAGLWLWLWSCMAADPVDVALEFFLWGWCRLWWG